MVGFFCFFFFESENLAGLLLDLLAETKCRKPCVNTRLARGFRSHREYVEHMP